MPKTINVLFLAAEAEPFIKVGGLGDVAGTMPRALRSISNDDIKLDVRLVIPHHPAVKADLKPLGMFSIKRGDSEIQIEASEAILNGMPVYFIGVPMARSILPMQNWTLKNIFSFPWPRSSFRDRSTGSLM